jgi:hypothetical protein
LRTQSTASNKTKKESPQKISYRGQKLDITSTTINTFKELKENTSTNTDGMMTLMSYSREEDQKRNRQAVFGNEAGGRDGKAQR